MALTERLQVLLEAIGGSQVSSEFSKVGRDASKTYTDIQKGAKGAGDATTKFGGLTVNMSSLVTAGIISVGTAVGVGLVDAMKKGVESYVQLGNQALQLQHITGGGAEQVSSFASILRQLGVSSDEAARPLGLLASNIATHSDKFTQAGVAIAHYKDGSTDLIGTLDNLRTKFQGTTDASQRDALAKSVLGRSYQNLLPYLTATNQQVAEFKRQAEAHGEILNQADIEKARQFSISMRELSAATQKVERDLASGLVPALTTAAKGLDAVARAGSNVNFTFGNGEKVNLLTGALGDASVAWHQLFGGGGSDANQAANALDGVTQAALVDDSATAKLKQTQDSLVSSAKNLRTAQQELASSHQAVAKAVEGVTRAQEGLLTAHEGVQKAEESLADAQQRLTDLLNKGAVDATKVAEAEKQLESASRGVEKAQQSVADAQDALNKALAGASPDDLTDAQLALQRATIGVAQAQDALNKAKQPHAGRNALEEEQAQLAVAEAIQQQREAQERLDAEKAKGTAQDPAVISAQRGIRDATQALTDAIDNQNDAAARLREAQAGDPSFDAQVAQAKRGVRDASEALTGAQRSERDAAVAVHDATQAVAEAKDREKNATYNLRDANYQLQGAVADVVGQNLDLGSTLDYLIARYPELQQVLANYQAQAAAAQPSGRQPNIALALAAIAGDVAGFAEGGWVPGAPGQAVPAVVHGGEFVLSRAMLASGGRGGGNGPNVIVNVAGSVVSERELTEIVFRALTKPGGRYSALRN